MPQQVEHLGQKYRRLKEKTPHTKVLTSFLATSLGPEPRIAREAVAGRSRRPPFCPLSTGRLREFRILWGVRWPQTGRCSDAVST